jgi:hypothetical protein
MAQSFKIGDKVTYSDGYKKEKGIIKSIRDHNNMFVVYHCGGEWNRYADYTAALTRTCDLKPGWEE